MAYACKYCGREFDTIRGRGMHQYRCPQNKGYRATYRQDHERAQREDGDGERWTREEDTDDFT